MALIDIVSGAALWRLWGRLGWNDILQRYRRSLLGPLWLTASMAIMVISLGFALCRAIQGSSRQTCPLSVGLVVLDANLKLLTEAGTLFTGTEIVYQASTARTYSVYVYRSCWSKLIIFAHNAIIILACCFNYEIWRSDRDFGTSGLLLVLLNGALAGLSSGWSLHVSAIFHSWLAHSCKLRSSSRQFWTPDLLRSGRCA